MNKNEQIQQMIEDCEARESKLSDWEVDFINSISMKIGKGLSDNQLKKLEVIWERIT